MEKDEKEINIPTTNLFYCFNFKDVKVEIYIANKNFTKFRTMEQFLNNEGDTNIKGNRLLNSIFGHANFKSPSGQKLICENEIYELLNDNDWGLNPEADDCKLFGIPERNAVKDSIKTIKDLKDYKNELERVFNILKEKNRLENIKEKSLNF